MERLTISDLMEWMIYIKHFSTPMRRADTNSALERNLLHQAHFNGKPPKLNELIPAYGKQRELPKEDEIYKRLHAWAQRAQRGK